MKRTLTTLSACLLALITTAQPVTVSFKPNAAAGQDASLWKLDNNVIPSGFSATPATLNFGNGTELSALRWTWNAAPGTVRGLVRFAGLNTLPAGAQILSATLVLRTPNTTDSWGNSYFTGSPYPLTNWGWVKRVLPGAANNWNEATVTWNTQPATDPVTGNWVTLPLTNSRWAYAVSLNVTTMVQQIVSGLVSDPNANNGFQVSMQDESTHYRAQIFASSDNADASSWPELRVTYDVCRPGFRFCSSTLNPYIYALRANYPQSAYNWTVNGTSIGTNAGVEANIAAISTVCLHAVNASGTSACTKCLTICPGDNPTGLTPCPGDFAFCSNTDNPFVYTFNAQPGMASYDWTFNGVSIGNTPSITYTFPTTSGYYPGFCLNAIDGNGAACKRCLVLCVPNNPFPRPGRGQEPGDDAATGNTEDVLRGDEPGLTTHVSITPNPTSTGWNIGLQAANKGSVQVTVYDITGRVLDRKKETVNPGTNTIYQDARTYPAGIYYLEIKGAGIQVKEKAVKVH